MKDEKKGVDLYPALNRIFINGEWIGSPLFTNFININEPIIDLGEILQMEDSFDVVVCTPSSSLYYFAQGIRLNIEQFRIEILLNSADLPDPVVGGFFTFTYAIAQLNKENETAIMIDLMQLPPELSDPVSLRNVKFPLWFADTACLCGNTYERTCVLLNPHHEPMFHNTDYKYTPENVEMCESYAKYLNQQHADLRTADGIVPGKLVLYQNKLYMIKDFQKRVIDEIVTETQAIILSGSKTDVNVPIFEFIEDCQWISPYPPVVTSGIDSRKITIVTNESILSWYNTTQSAQIHNVDHCDKAKFLEAFNTITSHIDKGIGEVGFRLDAILHIYDRCNSKPDLTAYVIPKEYGGGIIVNDNLPEYLNEDLNDSYDNYCKFDSEEDEDEGGNDDD